MPPPRWWPRDLPPMTTTPTSRPMSCSSLFRRVVLMASKMRPWHIPRDNHCSCTGRPTRCWCDPVDSSSAPSRWRSRIPAPPCRPTVDHLPTRPDSPARSFPKYWTSETGLVPHRCRTFPKSFDVPHHRAKLLLLLLMMLLLLMLVEQVFPCWGCFHPHSSCHGSVVEY